MKIYGLIGEKLTHSFSPKYFKDKFSQLEIDALYLPFEIPKEEQLLAFLDWARGAVKGLNVTIPYKEKVIPFLDEIDEAAKSIGAVNCIQVKKDGKLKGFNTDYIGFISPLKNKLEQGIIKKALVLGTGGASKAVVYALKLKNIEVQIVSRKSQDNIWSYEELLEKGDLKDFDLIVNTTPLGMNGFIKERAAINILQVNENHIVYDLIYNPSMTVLMKESADKGAKIINGLEMLHQQAEESWSLWNDI